MNIIDLMNIFLVVIIGLLGIAIIFFIVLRKKTKQYENGTKKEGENTSKKTKKTEVNGTQLQNVEDFMEFEKVEDNMIIAEKGTKYLMVLKCEGVNYYLMSEAEKLAVEQGFIQMLNTLRYPIQIYVQSRRTNLSDSIEKYKKSVLETENEMGILREQIKMLQQMPQADQEKIQQLQFELKKKTNVYDYGIDIIEYINNMSLNKNILQRQFYIIVPYYTSELGLATSFSEEEKRELSYVELYTRCRALAASLTACSVESKILDSEELCELLYIAYNRDDSTLLDLKKAMEANFYRLYSTSKDILQKRKEIVDKKVLDQALEKAQEAINVASIEELTGERIEKEYAKQIQDTAVDIIENSREFFSEEVIENAKEKVINEVKQKESKRGITITKVYGSPYVIMERIAKKRKNPKKRGRKPTKEKEETKKGVAKQTKQKKGVK